MPFVCIRVNLGGGECFVLCAWMVWRDRCGGVGTLPRLCDHPCLALLPPRVAPRTWPPQVASSRPVLRSCFLSTDSIALSQQVFVLLEQYRILVPQGSYLTKCARNFGRHPTGLHRRHGAPRGNADVPSLLAAVLPRNKKHDRRQPPSWRANATARL